VIAVCVAGLVGAILNSASAADSHRVPCGDSIETTKFPFLGDSRPEYQYREVLRVVAVPPAYMQGLATTNQTPWAYWRKQGLVVRAIGKSVTVTVPEGWRTRAAITWGNSGGPVSSLTIQGCSGSGHIGRAYAGGFYLRSPSACVPLIFTVGKRRATVRFGLGQRCNT